MTIEDLAVLLTPEGHPCAARECAVRVRYGYLMCQHHWRMVPSRVQRRISQHWRTFREHGSELAGREWAVAVHEAVEHVAGVELASRG